jgi:SAM-dependent methyltransferase
MSEAPPPHPRAADVVSLAPPRTGAGLDPAYSSARPEVVALVPMAARRVLDVGCSVGAVGRALRQRGCHVTGIEVDEAMALQARERLDTVLCADVERLADEGAVLGATFDCVVFADVLEHLRDPWKVVRWACVSLAPQGSIVVSVPNIRHAELVWSVVVRRRWPYKPVGIFDRTHLRWFARRNLPDLLTGTDLRIVEIRRTYMLSIARGPTSPINRLARVLGDFGTMQFVFRAQRGMASTR